MADWILAIGLVFVIEGLLWSVFGEQMRRMMIDVLQRDPAQLRLAGVILLAIGVSIVWIIKG